MMPPNRSGCCIICSETINWLHSTEERNGVGFHKALQILSNKNGIITSHISRQSTRLHRQKDKHGNGKLGNLYIYMTNQSPNRGNLWTRNVHHKNESQAWKSGSFQISSNLQSPAKHRLLSFRPNITVNPHKLKELYTFTFLLFPGKGGKKNLIYRRSDPASCEILCFDN